MAEESGEVSRTGAPGYQERVQLPREKFFQVAEKSLRAANLLAELGENRLALVAANRRFVDQTGPVIEKPHQMVGRVNEKAPGWQGAHSNVQMFLQSAQQRLISLEQTGKNWDETQQRRINRARFLVGQLLGKAAAGEAENVQAIGSEAQEIAGFMRQLDQSMAEEKTKEERKLRRDADDLADSAQQILISFKEKVDKNPQFWAIRFRDVARETEDEIATSIAGLSRREKEILESNRQLWRQFQETVEGIVANVLEEKGGKTDKGKGDEEERG